LSEASIGIRRKRKTVNANSGLRGKGKRLRQAPRVTSLLVPTRGGAQIRSSPGVEVTENNGKWPTKNKKKKKSEGKDGTPPRRGSGVQTPAFTKEVGRGVHHLNGEKTALKECPTENRSAGERRLKM